MLFKPVRRKLQGQGIVFGFQHHLGNDFIAAGMVEENWLKVAVAAMGLGVGLYLIPLAMIAHPALIGLADAPGPAVWAAAQVAAGLAAISYGVISNAAAPLRAALVAGGILILFHPVLF